MTEPSTRPMFSTAKNAPSLRMMLTGIALAAFATGLAIGLTLLGHA